MSSGSSSRRHLAKRSVRGGESRDPMEEGGRDIWQECVGDEVIVKDFLEGGPLVQVFCWNFDFCPGW
jgi:hypothetical protein